MQQHPIPQNVTQYQFRLVGDMTLKQFLELCIGLLMAYLFFASNLIFIIKWPLIIVSILFGAALAFFPIEDRPLDQWIINFLKAIYAPTRFIWQKTNKIPRLFLFEAHAPDVVNTITKTIKAPTSTSILKPISDLSEFEAGKVSSLDSLFSSLPTAPLENRKTGTQENEIVAKPTIAIRKLSSPDAVKNVVLHTPATQPQPKADPPRADTPSPSPSTTIYDLQSTISSPIATPSAPPAPSTIHDSTSTILTTPKHIAMPGAPKLPNLVAGVVVDKEDKLVDGAIVQIVSHDGLPQRAMKTNSLGQFYTSTPLGVGTYVIEVDKEGFNFSPQQIVVNDAVLSPVELRASS